MCEGNADIFHGLCNKMNCERLHGMTTSRSGYIYICLYAQVDASRGAREVRQWMSDSKRRFLHEGRA